MPADVDVPLVEVPLVEVPLVDVPLVEVPLVDVPLVEVPLVEVPLVEVPLVDVPLVEVPLVEVPLVDVLLLVWPQPGGGLVEVPAGDFGGHALLVEVWPLLELVPLELEVLELELLLVPLELELLLVFWPHPGGGLVDEPGVGGGHALLVEVFPATTWLEDPWLVAPASAAPIGTVSATVRAAPNRIFGRIMNPPQPVIYLIFPYDPDGTGGATCVQYVFLPNSAEFIWRVVNEFSSPAI
jgi:hypothetical protein